MDSEFLGIPEGSLDRSTSEPDIFGSSIRPRTCSNMSLQTKAKIKKKTGSLREKELNSQASVDSDNDIFINGSVCVSDDRLSSQSHNGHVTPSRAEVKAHAYERLKEELNLAQQELKLKDEQCDKLSRVRNELESELEELTASLFQEAHRMVHQARLKQDSAEKKLIEANNKVDLLQAEVNALKTLVTSRTPGNPKSWRRRHSEENLAPCSDCGSYDCDAAVPKNVGRCKGKRPRDFHNPNEPEVDAIMFREFLQWMDENSMSHDQPFLNRICVENVAPCLDFTNKELAIAIHHAIENNVLSMEEIRSKPIFRKCALTGTSRFCRHRVRISDNQEWLNICRSSRDRIAAVCDFYTYIRYIQRGLVKADATEIYWEIMRLRGKMAQSRLGLSPTMEKPRQKKS
ncbi:guanine nucleotide exchange factor for Rab-3A-like [Actinia tenebrosa]|uniref:Guanine nucleotide exchange factor for Rab-3A-like n=1 Tax=Actinia tenebrosa TaxID=6105 RepID=A0A6P8IE66_ACTTE|nr:guanine nucleotide exchange factor for Rab-3A-like [Actinia tenebrosa]